MPLLKLLLCLLRLLLLGLQLRLLQLKLLLLLHLLCVLGCRRPARHVCCCSLPALTVGVAGPWLLQLPANAQEATQMHNNRFASCVRTDKSSKE
jgi:hypothetical protein